MIGFKGLSRNYAILFIFFIALSFCFSATGFAGSDTHSGSQEAVHETTGEGGHGDESGDGHGGGDRTADLKDLLYRFINFALLVIILGWALKKAGIKDFFTARTEEIRNKLEDLKNEKESSENQYKELEQRLKAFEKEKENIIAQYKAEGEAEKEKILSEAKARVDQILAVAEMTIQQEMLSAKDRLRQEIVDLAAGEAQKMITERIKDEDQDQLIDDFIERLGKVH